jgi:fructokinase
VEAGAGRWLAAGAAVVIVTRGAAGATAFTRSGAVTAAAAPVTVRDTVGAGDTFMGAFLAALADRGLLSGGAAGRPGLPGRLTSDTVEDLLQVGAAAAAVTVSRAGADPPWRRELPTGLLG